MIATVKRKTPKVGDVRLFAELLQRGSQTAALYPVAPQDWILWHSAIFGETGAPFAAHHRDLWEWAWTIEDRERQPPFVALWARGGAKSTNAERVTVALGARGKRNYALYVSATQRQADEHVDSIAAMLESTMIQRHYPDLGQRAIGKYGASKGWKRSRLRTASGFTVDALGLDTAARGIRVEEYRPDFIVLDDVDEDTDTTDATAKKVKAITTKILPAGSTDCIVLFVQNLIHEDSIAAQLGDGRSRWLSDRIISGPHPAIVGLETETETAPDGRVRDVITGGIPTWIGQGMEECQAYIDRFGLDAFLIESQHEVGAPSGGLFEGVEYRRCDPDEVPDLVQVEVTVDPAVTSTDRSDSHGMSIGGIDANGIVYILWSWEQISTPEASLKLAIRRGMHFRASTVTVETDQGGDLWEESYHRVAEDFGKNTGPYQAERVPGFASARAGSIGSKIHRANMLLQAYKRREIVHVRNPEATHLLLEKALRRFPVRKPFDLVDSEFWLWHSLANGAGMPGFY